MSDQRTLSMSGPVAIPDDDDTLSPFMLLRPYWRVTLAAFLGWFLDAFDQVALLLCLPDIGKSLGVGLTAMGLVITAQSVGRILGNTSWGWLSDRYGRKLTFMIGVLWFAAFSGFTALVWTYLGMLIVQFLFGIGFGGEWTASASLLMESVPPRARSLASSIMMAGYECGFFVAAAVQAVVLPYWGWRAMFLIGVIPAILAIFIRRDVAESPVWLRLRSMPPVPAAIRPRMGFRLDGAAIQALLFMTVLQFQNAAIYSFYPTLLRKVQNLTPAEVFPLLGCYCLGSLVGKPLCGLLATRMGERTVFVTYFLITIMDIWPFISATSMWVLAGAALVMGLFGNSVFALVPHYLSQRFPSANRSLGMGCSYAVAAMGQGVCGFVVPWLGGQWGLPQAIESSVVIGTFMVAAVIFYQPPILPGRHMEGEESIVP